jgi:hypothetical protein
MSAAIDDIGAGEYPSHISTFKGPKQIELVGPGQAHSAEPQLASSAGVARQRHSRFQATLMGSSLTVPISEGKLVLGT